MPTTDLKDANDRTRQDVLVRTLYCPECGEYSGGGVCRICVKGAGPVFVSPEPAKGDNDG